MQVNVNIKKEWIVNVELSGVLFYILEIASHAAMDVRSFRHAHDFLFDLIVSQVTVSEYLRICPTLAFTAYTEAHT